MKDQAKTKEQLVVELVELRQRVAELEASDTERKRAEEALGESEEKYRLVSENIPVAVYSALPDEHSTNLFMSGRTEELTGYSVQQFLENPDLWTNILCPEDVEYVWQKVREHRENKSQLDIEYRIITKDKKVRWLRDKATPALDENGNIIRIDGFMEDITERRQAEEALRESEAHLRNLSDNLPGGMTYQLDMGVDGQTRQFTYVSAGVEKMHEVTAEAVLRDAQLLYGQIIEADRSLVAAQEAQAQAAMTTFSAEARFRLPSGATRWSLLTSAPRRAPNGHLIWDGIEIDITERKRAEEEIQKWVFKQEVLREAMLALTTTLDRDEVVDRILAQLQKVVPYDTASVQLLREGHLEIVGGRGFPNLEELLGVTFDSNQEDNPNREVVRTQAPFIVDDVPTVYAEFLRDPHAPAGIRSWLGVPMLVGERLIGMIALDKSDPGFYTQEHAQLAEAFAAQAAIAIENAQLFEQARQELAERKRTEEALLESEEKFRNLAEHSPNMIFINKRGKVVYANRRCEEMMGYTTEEFYSADFDFLTLIVPEHRELVKVRFGKHAKGEDVEPYEYTLVTKDSRRIEALLTAKLIDYEGERAILGTVTDITERKQAEEEQRQALAEALQATRALHKSEKHFRTLIEQSPFGIEIFDPDGVLRQVNKAWERLWNANAQDVIGEYNALENEQLQQSSVFPLIERLFAGESVDLPDTEFDPAASGLPGRKRWIRAHTYHIKDEDNQLQNVVLIHEDITEHKQAEEERERLLAQIQEQAQRMQQIMDTVPEGVLLLNADGQVLLANPVAERDLSALTDAKVGDTITHLGNRPLAELLTSPPKGLWHEVKADTLHGREERIFEIIARPMEKGSEPEDWVLVINDATDQREIEQRVQQQERLAAVGQLAAGIAHDFNNIMATIVLYAQMTAQMEKLPSVVRERMGTINQQAGHAVKLIQQILDFSRRAVLERQPLDLALLLEDHARLLKRTLPESIEVKLTHGPGEHMIHADPTRMQQVVTNLAVNARDAMPGGGTLHIRLERIRVRRGESPLVPEIDPGEWVQMTVSDTGTGIPPDVLPHIFDPFFTTKAPGEGSGLGLAQVHGIVGQHGGRIDVESHTGKGTAFIIYLPAFSTHPPELSGVSELESLTLPTGKGETILVVEDNAVVRKALVESLELLNYHTREATNGQEALAMLEQYSDDVDLLLSDVVMPGMGGIALLHALKERGLTVKVVMITGHLLEKELDELRVQGMADWLHKPPELEKLAEVVARVLGTDW